MATMTSSTKAVVNTTTKHMPVVAQASPPIINKSAVVPNQYPRIPKKSTATGPGLGIQLLTAGTAACIADCLTFPLDTVKVRLQVCNCFKSNFQIIFFGVEDYFFKIIIIQNKISITSYFLSTKV